MKRKTKMILIFSVSCIAAGALLTGAGRLWGGSPGFAWTRDGIVTASSSRDPYSMEKTPVDELTSVEINIGSAADISILPSDDEKFYLEYLLDGAYDSPQFEISSGRLTLAQAEGTASGGIFLFGSGLNFGSGFGIKDVSPYVRLYVPSDSMLSDVSAYSDAGSVEVRDLSAGKASFSASFGDLTLDNCIFGSLEAVTDSGSIEGSDIQTGSLVAENDFGSTAFRSTAVTSARITASSGDILLEAQELETLEGSNDFGDTRICLSDPLSSYSCNLSTDFGDIILPDNISGGHVSDGFGEGSYTSEGSGDRQITFTASAGEIEIEER
ncbi:MAG TPA: DUF4097 domain-containing protein [Candidatus Mediterraneibacter norfolkensis]|nr:DUF4097 domain-containing protein [Candidatus Mediterraneibacter norfolkensis]